MNTESIMEENNLKNDGMEAQVDGTRELPSIRTMMHNRGRVNSEDSDTDEGLGMRKSSSRPKTCKTRRARRKAFRPYYQLSEEERDVREEREKLRIAKLKERMWAKGRIIAPYNTTQFLMADQPEEDSYFTKPTNDQDFMSKEFKKDYAVQYMSRLEKMTKEMLLNEYMIMERKNENLEQKLERVMRRDEENLAKENEILNANVFLKDDAVDKISKFQREMERLKLENQRLLAENFEMKEMLRNQSDESSSFESSTSSSSSSSDSDSDTEEKKEESDIHEKESKETSEDNGYESNLSVVDTI